MTRAELLEELMLERFGPRPKEPRTKALTPSEVHEFEEEHERAQQRMRREALRSESEGHG